MKNTARISVLVTVLAVFIGLPMLLYVLGDAPRRSLLKETISVLTLLSFSLMLGQFFLARSNEVLLELFRPRQIQKVHKVIAYGAAGVLLVHPFLIVLPRYFEAGVRPWDALVTMLTTFDSLGVLLGLAAWGLMVVVLITSIFRIALIKRFAIRYRHWRYFHSGLTVAFIAIALWHAIELGRHTGTAMATFLITLAVMGILMLARLYWAKNPESPQTISVSEGAKS
ncbi:MAG: ferric reductase-like transmembrane domain-containing protein [Candidatus Krumholzibacteria bacterium]|nr:ferric reductase-like transmembrane domain-containing protein [Candidatus Krumholzibacteria bacterium]